ncbi:hypothetical protein AGMMS50229_19620 [Campylobacterota bacterium]|nr:hypothetical protein AGMMS50229_19620 [Campylobacterota bacterium]
MPSSNVYNVKTISEGYDFLSPRMQMIIQQTDQRRFREFWGGLGIFFGVLFATAAVALAVTLATDVNNTFAFDSKIAAFFGGMTVAVFGVIGIVTSCVITNCPFIFYFWVNIHTSRQRMFLALIQTALETRTPLSLMVHAHALESVSPFYRNKLNRFATLLEAGKPLSRALTEEPGLLRYDVQGILGIEADQEETLQALENIAPATRFSALTQSNSIVRTGYFLVLCFPMFWVTLFFNMWIIPQFEKIFLDFGLPLPPLTQLVFGLRGECILLFLLVPALALFLIVHLILQTDVFLFRPFLFRRMFRKADSARFLRIFNMGLKHQMPIPDILAVYQRTVSSAYLAEKALRIKRKITNGLAWIDALRREKFVTTGESQLLESAQRAGNVNTVISEIAESKEQKQTAVNDLMSKFIFIPMILVVGFFVGAFTIAVFLPIVELITDLSRIQ